MKLSFACRLALAASFAIATSAFADSKADIVGKWSGEGDKIEFKADGTFAEELGGTKVTGKYSVPDDTHLKEEFDGPMSAVGAVTSAMTLKGDTLEVTPEGGAKTTLARVKADKE